MRQMKSDSRGELNCKHFSFFFFSFFLHHFLPVAP